MHGDVFKTVDVEKGILSSVEVLFEEHSGTLVPRGSSPDVTTSVEISDTVSAPITQGQVLGEVVYLIDGEVYGRTNLVAGSDVRRLNFPNMLSRTFEDWFSLLRW